MLFRGIDDNVLGPHPSNPGVYQYEAKKLELYKYINKFFWLEPNQKNCQDGGARFSINIVNLISFYTTSFLKGCWV